ncbi:MAG: hypothetical protein AAGE59_19760 [Cyanobacteria bacterium P01_F01_bin.86]
MKNSRFKLRFSHLSLVGAFLGLWLAPDWLAQMTSQLQTELETQQAAAEPAPIPPEPSQLGSDRFLESVLVRANYLLDKGRESGDVSAFIHDHYQTVSTELQGLEQSSGVFDGEAAIFAQVANLSAEQQALELVQFWLEHPDQVRTVAGMQLSPMNPQQANAREVDYANLQP